MKVTKKHIVDGVTEFISDTLMPKINDGQLRFVLSMMKDTIKKKPEVMDTFLENPIISSSITEEDGMYEIGHFVDTMRTILDDCECYPITVPEIPLFSPQKKIVKITASDFEALVNDIRNEEPEPQSEDEDL